MMIHNRLGTPAYQSHGMMDEQKKENKIKINKYTSKMIHMTSHKYISQHA